MQHKQQGGEYLFLLNSLIIGGSEKKTIRVVNEFHRRGFPVHLAYLNQPHTLHSELDPKVPCFCLQRKGKVDPRAAWSLLQYVRRHSVVEIFCVNLYPMLYGWFAAQASRRSRRACSVFVNTTEFQNASGYIAMMLIYLPLMWRMKRIIFGCEYQRDLWTTRYRLDRSKCLRIYNGVDTDWFCAERQPTGQRSARKMYGLSQSDIIIGMVGQLRPWKQHSDLLDACAQLWRKNFPVRVVIVGDGQERRKLEQIACKKGLQDRVLFIGQVQDVRPALMAMDIFVLTSSSVETFSNAALEAMAIGKPLVLSRISGASEMVSDGVNGYLYSPRNVTELVSRLKMLIVDAEQRKRMGQRARAIAQERFSLGRMIAEYEKHLLSS